MIPRIPRILSAVLVAAVLGASFLACGRQPPARPASNLVLGVADLGGGLVLPGLRAGGGAGTLSSLVLNDPTPITVCASNCAYTTITEACAANTATSDAPLVILVGPGHYSENPSCSGQDHLAIIGSGRGISTVTGTDQSDGAGVFLMGTSRNYIIDGFTVSGQRTIYQCGSGTCGDGTGSGGGTIIVRNSEFITTTNQALEDCFFFEHLATGTTILWDNNDCTTNSDGLTFNNGEPENVVTLVSRNSRYFAGADRFSGGAFTFVSTPTKFYSMNDVLEWTATNSSTYLSLAGIRYLQQTSGCTSGCYGYISGLAARITNQNTGFGGNDAEGVLVDSTVTYPLELHIINSDIQVVATSATATTTYGVIIRSTTSGVDVTLTGGRVRSSGGITNTDIHAGTSATLTAIGTDYATKSGTSVNARREFGVLTTSPLRCFIGDHYTDISGADCVCSAPDTWSNTDGVGACANDAQSTPGGRSGRVR